MNRSVKAQGVKCPLIKEGDDIVKIISNTLINDYQKGVWKYDQWFSTGEGEIHNKDIVGITESVVARSAGLYVTIDDIAKDIENKFGKDSTILIANPIYSRNRFSMILKGIARTAKKISMIMPDYDEVGNPKGVNPFTGVNIEEYYKDICEKENCEFSINDCNNYREVLYTHKNFIYCGLHDYNKEIKSLLDIDPQIFEYNNIYTLADICSDKNPDFGLLGSNKATDDKLKLFPTKELANKVCLDIKNRLKELIHKDVIVCVYGDGCFKDAVGEIWEFADPITMPGYTDKELLESNPCEVKLKYAIDNEGLTDIKDLKRPNQGEMGTTPRVYRDLLASLMDLISGSGDRATPVVLIQNYF